MGYISFVKLKEVIFNCKFSILLCCCLFFLGYLLCRQPLFVLINVVSLFLLLLLLSKIKYGKVFYFGLFFFVACDFFYYIQYSSSIYLGVLSSIFETTPVEAKEMFGNFFWKILIVSGLSIILSILVYKELKYFSLKLRGVILLYLLFTMIIPVYVVINIYRNKDMKSIALFAYSPLLSIQTIVGQKFPLVYNDLFTLYVYSVERYRMYSLKNSQKEFPQEILSLGNDRVLPSKIYVVIGESSLRDHYSLYGYEEPTTPFLDSLKQNSSAISFYNGISPACVTRDAIRFSLTFATPFNQDAFFKKKNIINLAKDKGYDVLWISNQERVGAFDNYTGILASEADKSVFETNHDLYRNDLGLIPKLKQYGKASQKQFVFLHLIGSHEPYQYRYDDVDVKAISQKYSTHITNYDRSIHYTDRVLSQIYKYILGNDESALLYYFSDHGECIGLGHAQIAGGRDQFKTPLIVLKHNIDLDVDEILQKYENKEIEGINNLNTVHILSEILGYKIEQEALDNTRKESEYIYHIDGNIYPYKSIPE